MRQIVSKLSGRRGETLTETLCAILITALAAALLVSMPGAARRLNKMALEQDTRLYDAVSAAEAQDEPISGQKTEQENKKLTVRLTSDGRGETEAVFEPISIYGTEGVVISYGYDWNKEENEKIEQTQVAPGNDVD